ncbi:energy-coupling factor transporter transmembrane component T family protein [Pseudolysinimonas sp.]|uniref:energy-coupling factor transporter transmembrane component T family protein n=1 Tax=Pseudolysinimonas sp. TaxID=2680009 RepID=UPI003F7E2C8D
MSAGSVVAPAARGDAHTAPRINPVARIAAALVIAIGLAWSVDTVSAGVALVLELALLPLLRIPWRRFWVRTAAVWIAAPLGALTLALYGRPSGHVWAHWLLVEVSDGSLQLAAAAGLRVLAIALPAVALLVGVDATELADGLAQVARLPARFVIGSLAAFRMLGVLGADLRSLELARRARGIGDRGRVRQVFGLLFATLVLAVRRGSALATAMEARGFGAPGARTWARPSPFGRREVLVVAVAVAVVAVAVGAAVVTGWWHPVVG